MKIKATVDGVTAHYETEDGRIINLGSPERIAIRGNVLTLNFYVPNGFWDTRGTLTTSLGAIRFFKPLVIPPARKGDHISAVQAIGI